MRRIVLLCSVIGIGISALSQDGSIGSPFTSLSQAHNAPAAGVYYFNIGGFPFSTQVDTSGWVLMAASSGAASASSLTGTGALDFGTDQILSNSLVYSAVTVIKARFSSLSGPNTPFDVQTSDANVLTNLENNQTLSFGLDLTPAQWTGTGTEHMDLLGTSDQNSLDKELYHADGNFNGLHWRPLLLEERIAYDQTGGSNPINLWIQEAPPVSLPITLLNFNASIENQKNVKITWTTVNEIDTKYFEVERSNDGRTFAKIAGVSANNSVNTNNYSYVDNSPFAGNGFYRIKVIDISGSYTYSVILKISFSKILQFDVYPNPTVDFVTVTGVQSGYKIRLFNIEGRELLQKISSGQSTILNLKNYASGIYILRYMDDSGIKIKRIFKN